jgi:hypothetical protein
MLQPIRSVATESPGYNAQ